MRPTVAHRINRKLWPYGKPWKRTTLAMLRVKERMIAKRLAPHIPEGE